MTFTMQKKEVAELNGGGGAVFPKYTSQLINWANQNAQGTRPKTVGQMSELFQQYQSEMGTRKVSLEGWKKWYTERYPDAMETATDKIYRQVENLRDAMPLIDREMVREWVEDLVITKTYSGLYVQKAILAKLAEKQGSSWRLAGPEEESRGIDGYVGETAYSIKPDSYQMMDRLSEKICVKMIRYHRDKDSITVEVEE